MVRFLLPQQEVPLGWRNLIIWYILQHHIIIIDVSFSFYSWCSLFIGMLHGAEVRGGHIRDSLFYILKCDPLYCHHWANPSYYIGFILSLVTYLFIQIS